MAQSVSKSSGLEGRICRLTAGIVVVWVWAPVGTCSKKRSSRSAPPPLPNEFPQSYHRQYEGFVGRLVLIDGFVGALAAAVLLALWYVWFAHYNRRRGILALTRVQAACGGRGSVLEPRWRTSSLLQASLHLPSRWFEDAQLTVRLVPRQMPFRWLLSHWRKQKETITFEADLDHRPEFQLDVMHHRWAGSSSGSPRRARA